MSKGGNSSVIHAKCDSAVKSFEGQQKEPEERQRCSDLKKTDMPAYRKKVLSLVLPEGQKRTPKDTQKAPQLFTCCVVVPSITNLLLFECVERDLLFKIRKLNDAISVVSCVVTSMIRLASGPYCKCSSVCLGLSPCMANTASAHA